MVEREEALNYHRLPRPGKLEIQPTKPCLTQQDLSLAYSPGVAEPCREIAADAGKVFEYTGKGNLVGVVTNGSAVLGLGDIGPAAGKPVMEGKAVLFKRFAGIDVFDIELDATDVDSFCAAVRAMAPTFGGINLEDIKAPDCFLIEERLSAELDIPVFHDDQHGTAIITCAGVVNSLLLVGKRIEDTKFVFSGAGAAAIATARLLESLGALRQNMLMVDSKGVVREGDPNLARNPYKAQYAAATERRTLADALVDADVFIGVSIGGIVTTDMVKQMAEKPVIFAMANPDPEIPYDDARAARPDAIVATGRTDYPNQVNNVLGFPFIFRGALDVRAREINEAMMIGAVNALAELAREEVDEAVSKAYGGAELRFGPEYIIPKPFDPRVLLRVAPAVAVAASLSGVARNPLSDEEAYRASLERYLGAQREVMRFAVTRAQHHPRRVVFADGENERVIRASARLIEEKTAVPVLVGEQAVIQQRAAELDVDLGVDRGFCQVCDPRDSELHEEFLDKLLRRRARKGMAREDARRAIRSRNYFASMMLSEGHVDGMVAGLGGSFPETLRPVLRVVGSAADYQRVAGVHLMVMDNQIFFFADTTVTLDPTAEDLAEIACLTADLARSFDVTPRVAMLSFSNFGSVRNERSEKVRVATELVRTWRPELEVEGEIHADIALMPDESRSLFPHNRLTGRANVLVFPSLESANIAQKVAQCSASEATVGPILVGLNRPVNILAPYAAVSDIVMTAAITAMMSVSSDDRELIEGRREVVRIPRLSSGDPEPAQPTLGRTT